MAISDQDKAIIKRSVAYADEKRLPTMDIRTTALLDIGGGDLIDDATKEDAERLGDKATCTVHTRDMVNLLGGEAKVSTSAKPDTK